MLIDSHCHLDDNRFDPDRDQVRQRAELAGIAHIIVPATHADRWGRLAALCQAADELHPAYGMHPQFMKHHQPSHLQQLEQWLTRNPSVAIGECGLDFYGGKEDKNAQLTLFHGQLALAQQSGLPLIIHARKAVQDVLLAIRDYPGTRGVLHSFSGSFEQARDAIDRGYFLGIGGPFTWSRSTKLQRLLRQLPADALLLETDAPDQPDESHRGCRNEPAFLADIGRIVAGLRGDDVSELVATSADNARRLFGLV